MHTVRRNNRQPARRNWDDTGKIRIDTCTRGRHTSTQQIIHTCIYQSIHTRTHWYVHTCINTYIHTYKHDANMHTCVHVCSPKQGESSKRAPQTHIHQKNQNNNRARTCCFFTHGTPYFGRVRPRPRRTMEASCIICCRGSRYIQRVYNMCTHVYLYKCMIFIGVW